MTGTNRLGFESKLIEKAIQWTIKLGILLEGRGGGDDARDEA